MLQNLKNWLPSQRRTRRGAVSHTSTLEQRTLLAATFSVVGGTTLEVNGTALDDNIAVGINPAGNFEIVEAGVATDTGVANDGSITLVELRGLVGADVLTLNASLGTVPGEVSGDVGEDIVRAHNAPVSPAQNILRGGPDNDKILGSNSADKILGDGGNDQLNGRGGDDSIFGGTENDAINGGTGNDKLFGGLGADVLRGDSGDDKLYANNAANDDDFERDRLFGGGDAGDQFFSHPGVLATEDQFFA